MLWLSAWCWPLLPSPSAGVAPSLSWAGWGSLPKALNKAQSSATKRPMMDSILIPVKPNVCIYIYIHIFNNSVNPLLFPQKIQVPKNGVLYIRNNPKAQKNDCAMRNMFHKYTAAHPPMNTSGLGSIITASWSPYCMHIVWFVTIVEIQSWIWMHITKWA